MFYSDEEIQSCLDNLEIKNTVYFIFLLPTFIWCRREKRVVEYTTSPTPYNELITLETPLILLEKGLEQFLKDQELNESDVLVFCINSQYFPNKKKKKYIRFRNIIKGVI